MSKNIKPKPKEQADNPFGLKLNNIPALNIRMEFNQIYAFVFSPNFHKIFVSPYQPVEMSILVWRGMPDDLMTLLLQRAVLGLEGYLPFALIFTSTILRKASNELTAKLNKPFDFGARSAVMNIYHHMPAEVHHELSLLHLDETLFEKNRLFYKHIRNPLFHGKTLSGPKVENLREAFDHLARIYEWIDYWHDLEKLIPGGGRLTNVRSKYPPIKHK